MGREYALTSRDVPHVSTACRQICTPIPHPEDVRLLTEMRRYEPRSLSGQPPIIWDKAIDCTIYDRFGNRWIDMSSGVVLANSGHCNPAVQRAIVAQAEHGLLHSYVFANVPRGALAKRLVELAPEPLNKAFLLSTGAEATECAIKLCRSHGYQTGGKQKITVVTFEDGFHGKTMGAQMAGGLPGGKDWIVNVDKDIVQVPFPNAYYYDWADESRPDYSDDACFARFLEALDALRISYDSIAGVMSETFQGAWAQLMPKGFLQRLRRFCDEHDIVMVLDEVQAGFGRTGKLFGFMHAGVVPDLVCCGKGVSSSLPLSCVIGRADIMDEPAPNVMTSTHSGNPVCAAAALANINYIAEHGLSEHAAALEPLCRERLSRMKKRHSRSIGWVGGTGLAFALLPVKPDTKDIDEDAAYAIIQRCMEKGVLFFAPVGRGATVKLAPPLTIQAHMLTEALDVLDEAVDEVLA